MSAQSDESGYVWTPRDQTDHDAGHPSGYDCDGYAIMPPTESCGHRLPLEGGAS